MPKRYSQNIFRRHLLKSQKYCNCKVIFGIIITPITHLNSLFVLYYWSSYCRRLIKLLMKCAQFINNYQNTKQFVSLSNTNFKKDIQTKFGRNDVVVPNLPLTRPLTMWSGDNLKTSYRSFHQRYNHQTWNESANIRMERYHSQMSRELIIESRDIQKFYSVTFKKAKTTKLGGITYQNERTPFLHVTWPYRDKVIKAAAPKLALMKDTHNHRPRKLWLRVFL